MTIFCLEMRSTQDWGDVRYRSFTTSASKADAFKRIPKIQFTDSGHGIVPVVNEGRRGRDKAIHTLADYVNAALAKATGDA